MKRRICAFCVLAVLLSLLTSMFLPNVNYAASAQKGTVKGMISTVGEGFALLELCADEQTPSKLTVHDGRYTLNAPAGDYVLTVSKAGNVSRTYAVTLKEGDCNLYLKLHSPGDLSGNGRVEMGDVARTYAHCKGTVLLKDEYLLRCADCQSNGSINIGDVSQIYALATAKRPGTVEGVPACVKQEADRVVDLVRSKRTDRSLVFAALSDIHYPYDDQSDGDAYTSQSLRYAGMAITEMKEQLSLDFMSLLGDYVMGASDSTIEESKAALEYVDNVMYEAGVGVQQIWLQGNHDRNPYNTDDGDLTAEEIYSYIFCHNTGTVVDPAHPRSGYGYKDFEKQKLRVVYWNSSELSGVETVTDHCFTADQFRWMAEVAFDFSSKTVPSEWGVVMLSHMPVNWNNHLKNFVDAYISGTCAAIQAADDASVTVDFTGKERAEFICAINGHTHNYRASRMGKNQFLQISVPQICAGRYNEYGATWPQGGGELDAGGKPVYYLKQQNSAASTSFCVFVVDRDNRKIHALHYGAGIDREFDY